VTRRQGDCERQQIFLASGEIHVSSTPSAVTTILGACVALCMTDVERRRGGIIRYTLPAPPDRQGSLCHGSIAIPRLIESLLALGCRRERLTAKLFGGANVPDRDGESSQDSGLQNVHIAYDILGQAGIPIITEDVWGFRKRRLTYYTDDGTAWVRKL
jgi:chemotaxis protein CheD